MDMLRWMMPMPPCCASAIARCDSVTVSMAAETIGMFKPICARQSGARIDFGGQHFAAGRLEQNIVEGEALGEYVLNHGDFSHDNVPRRGPPGPTASGATTMRSGPYSRRSAPFKIGDAASAPAAFGGGAAGKGRHRR